MGNRATVIFTDGDKSFSPAVYLHWNGGPESVYSFLAELDRRKARCDQDYECARFIQLVGEFFDQETIGSTSLGVTNGPASADIADLQKVMTDHGDNGFYLVNRTGGKMTVRRFTEHYSRSETGEWLGPELREMPPDEVKQERESALKDKYTESLRETFLQIQGKRGIENH